MVHCSPIVPHAADGPLHRCHCAGKNMLNRTILTLLFLVAPTLMLPEDAMGQTPAKEIRILVRLHLRNLLKEHDTDGDRKITIDDSLRAGPGHDARSYSIESVNGEHHRVVGIYYLSNLLQELTLLAATGVEATSVRLDRIYEKPTDRISRSIRDLYWDGLTRTIDERGLATIVADEKVTTVDNKRYVYIPAKDRFAYRYYDSLRLHRPDLHLQVVRLPASVTPAYVKSLHGIHGILSLGLRQQINGSVSGVPFVVPGGRFNEMYGWDSYFILLGLLNDNRLDLAKALVDNFIYELNHYGSILNANRTYYLTRSQPPFFTSMVLECYQRLPKDSSSRAWLQSALCAAIEEYQTVWMGPDRLTATGLSRYVDRGAGPPPEVEAGHYDTIFSRYAARRAMSPEGYKRLYSLGLLHDPELDAFFLHDRAMRESGHDTGYRLYGRCADLVTVDLNSLLYKYELDIAETIEREFADSLLNSSGQVERSAPWYSRAATRRDLMHRYLWNSDRGMFFDFDFKEELQLPYESATTFFALWAGVATQEQATSLVYRALPHFEVAGGVVSSTEASRGAITPEHPLRQWDYPFGWAPHQILVWRGLNRYGFGQDAQRLAYRWLYTITLNASRYNGTIPEKFDVVRRSHDVFAEYGNVGVRFSYITREGFGWTNASFQLGLHYLDENLRSALDLLVPPELLFTGRQ